MPGGGPTPPGFPLVPFGFQLGPNGQWISVVPTPVQTPPSPGPPPLPAGRIITASRRRPYIGRTVPPPHLAKPVTGPPPFQRGTFVRPLARPLRVRQVPPTAILPTPTFLPFVPQRPFVAGLDAVERLRRRRYLPSTLLPPPIVGQPPVPAGTFVGLGPAERIRRRRYVPTVLVAPPVLVAPFLAPPATIVSNHFLRRRSRNAPTSTILPAPTFLAPGARYANFVSLGAVARPKRLRSVPPSTILPTGAPPQPPVARGTYVTQSIRRGTLRVPTHVETSPPIVARPATARALVVHAAGPDRRYLRVQRPRVAAAITATSFVAPPATIVAQATERAARRRYGSVRLPSRGAPPPVPYGTFVLRATQRQPRPLLRARTAPPVSPTTFVSPPAYVVAQAVERSYTRRRGVGVVLPRLGAQPSVRPGTFANQAIERAYTRRSGPPAPHLARPLVAPAVPFRSAGFLFLQAVQRTTERRYRDVVPAPRLPPRTLAPAGPGATVKLQSLARQLRRREGRVLLPELGSSQPVRRGTFVSQANLRPYGRRTVPEPHLAGPVVPLVASFVAPRALVVSQALERGRQTRFRSVPSPRLAAPLVAKPPLRPGTIVLAARVRQLVRREGRVRLPVLGAAPPAARPAKVVGQALRRPYVRRETPGPRLAKPVVIVFVPPVKTMPTILGQAMGRPYYDRRKLLVPPRIPPNLTPPPPPPPPPPLPPVTQRGVTEPREPTTGETRPSYRSGTVSPREVPGTTSPRPQSGTTSPRPRNP